MNNIILKQFQALIENETNAIALFANASAFLKEVTDNINWVGFYFGHANELVLGPFQGKVACSHLQLNQGVCAKAYTDDHYLYVPDVHTFKGHIACDSASNSELVIPIHFKQKLFGVLDIDSPLFNRFSETEIKFFLEIVKILEQQLNDNSDNVR